MKLQMLCLAGAAVLVVLPQASAEEQASVQADLIKELRELRTRVEALEVQQAKEKEEYERTIGELRREVDRLHREAGPTAQPEPEDELEALVEELTEQGVMGEEEPGFLESVGRAIQSSNPDISLIGDFLGHYSSNEGRGFDDEFRFRHLELGISGNIDPYARADVFIGMGQRDDGDWHTHVDEAYLTFLTLPHDLQPRIGRFKSSFGKANPQHLHALPWIEYPLIVQNYFGDHGLSGDGAGISWLVPNKWDKYIEVTYEIINNDNNSLFAGQDTDDFVHLVHLKNFFDLSDASTLELGASFATAPNDEGHGGNRSMVEGIDITYKWRPPEAGHYKSFLWQTELLAAQADLRQGQETSWGMYSAADYQFAKRWVVGLRYDYSQMPYSSSQHEHGYSTYLTFLQSHYVLMRFGYMYTDRNFRLYGDKDEHELFLQCIFNLGPHRAHKY